MNRIFYILILCLSHFFGGYAQSDLFSRLPQEERDGFYENACHYIQNTYYYQIAEAIANPAIHKYLIEYLMASDEARFQPEAIPEASKQRLLSPSQYLMSLSHAFRKDSELEFSVSNFGYNNQVKSNPDNPLNCFIQVEYDLEVRQQNETLLKRRCRMCCLFPNPLIKTQVKTMQVEPLKDIFILASNDKRFNEAMQWYEQGLKEKAVPIFKALAEKGYTEAEWKYGNYLENCKLNWEKAIYWYKRAAKKNHVKAQISLGDCYQYVYRKKYTEAVKWYTKAAEQGNAQAQIKLGSCYKRGIGVPQNINKAIEWYTKAVNQGNIIAKSYLEDALEIQSKMSSVCRGTIKDEKGNPIENVSIVIKGTSIGAKTDKEGNFLLEGVKLNNELELSHISYPTYTCLWEGFVMDVTLKKTELAIRITKRLTYHYQHTPRGTRKSSRWNLHGK